MKSEVKQWQKPELIILVRSRPQESVLTACKVTGGYGPNATNNACLWEHMCQNVCSSVDPS